MADDKEDNISEMEIELYSGDLSDVMLLTAVIADKYKLEPENRCKYSRAIALLENSS